MLLKVKLTNWSLATTISTSGARLRSAGARRVGPSRRPRGFSALQGACRGRLGRRTVMEPEFVPLRARLEEDIGRVAGGYGGDKRHSLVSLSA
jgi:hypothetical protein